MPQHHSQLSGLILTVYMLTESSPAQGSAPSARYCCTMSNQPFRTPNAMGVLRSSMDSAQDCMQQIHQSVNSQM